jgi:GntR family transcriptional regulator
LSKPSAIQPPAAGNGETVTSEAPPAFQPLYRQVKERLLNRLIDGTWAPGTPLPSEQQLAQELNVSQGTVRKALDALTAEHLLVRAQGRGTFVAEAEDRRILFRYFRLTADDGARQFPESAVASLRQRIANAAQRDKLQLAKSDRVWLIERTRELAGRPVIFETIALPVALFPGLDQIEPIPNNVYALYASRFGLTVGRVTEKLKAILASAEDAAELGCAEGAPLLQIDRIASSLRGTPMEWRVSRCLTDAFHYLSEL